MSEINFKATKVFNDTWNAVKSGLYKLIEQQGGSRSSKTWSDFQVVFLDLYENPMTVCTVLRDTQKSCRDIVEIDWIKWLSDPMGRKAELEKGLINVHEFDKFVQNESLIRYFTRNKTNHTWTFKHNSSFIRFTGLDDENDAMGMTQDVCWINEPYAFSHDVYLQLSQRTSKYILFDWNPKQNHWVDTERKKENTITLKSTLLDNPFCPKESRLQILSYQPIKFCNAVESSLLKENEAKIYSISDNKLNLTKKQLTELKRCQYNEDVDSANDYRWQVYGLGLKAEKPNRIFIWKSIDYQEYLKIESTIYIGVDWGKVDPWGIIEVKYLDGCLYVHELNYASENEIRAKLSNSELHQIAGDETAQETGIVTMYFNKLNISKNTEIICDTNRPLKIASLRRLGYDSAMPAPNKSILDGIDLLDNLTVYVTSCSENIIYEQENYSRKVDRYGVILDEPEDKDNHTIDPIRYVALYLQSQGILTKL